MPAGKTASQVTTHECRERLDFLRIESSTAQLYVFHPNMRALTLHRRNKYQFRKKEEEFKSKQREGVGRSLRGTRGGLEKG